MSEERLTYLERWTLAIGAPVIAAGIIAVAGFLWQVNDSQIEIERKLDSLAENAYTKQRAQLDQQRLKQRLDSQNKRLDRHEERLNRLEQHVPFGASLGSGS